MLNGHITDRQGSTLYINCPVHTSESHRSFHIWLDKQGWYCHGCGKGGDILQLVEFVQSHQVTTGQAGKMPDSHRKARDWLAAKAGLPPLSNVGLSPKEIKELEAARHLNIRAWECLTAITEFYKDKLFKNSEAANWLKEKYALDAKAIETFLIGYADNDGLIGYLKKLGFTLREMTASGAFRPSSQNEDVVYPTFENRIIFPYLSKGRTVFMIARKTPWTPDNKYEAGKYKKLPVHDPQKRRYIAEGIDNGTLYNEDKEVIEKALKEAVKNPFVTSSNGKHDPLEKPLIENEDKKIDHLYPAGGKYPLTHPVSTEAISKVDAVRDKALSLGWTEKGLYQDRGRFKLLCGQDYGLVCYLGKGERIGEVTRESIEIIKPSGISHQFYNRDVDQPWIKRSK